MSLACINEASDFENFSVLLFKLMCLILSLTVKKYQCISGARAIILFFASDLHLKELIQELLNSYNFNIINYKGTYCLYYFLFINNN